MEKTLLETYEKERETFGAFIVAKISYLVNLAISNNLSKEEAVVQTENDINFILEKLGENIRMTMWIDYKQDESMSAFLKWSAFTIEDKDTELNNKQTVNEYIM